MRRLEEWSKESGVTPPSPILPKIPQRIDRGAPPPYSGYPAYYPPPFGYPPPSPWFPPPPAPYDPDAFRGEGPLNSTRLSAAQTGALRLNLTSDSVDSVGGGLQCGVCARLLGPAAATRRYASRRRQERHAEGHRSKLLSQPFAACFPPATASGEQSTASTTTQQREDEEEEPSIDSDASSLQQTPSTPDPEPPAPNDSRMDESLPSSSFLQSLSRSVVEGAAKESAAHLLASHVGKMRSTGLRVGSCAYPKCASTPKSSLANHVLTHSKKPTVECGICGYKNPVAIWIHNRRQHPDQVMQSVSLRGSVELEEYLVNLTFICFPLLLDSGFLLATPGRPLALLASLDALRLRLCTAPARCRLRACGAVVKSNSTWQLELHVLTHFPRPVFQCEQCRFQGQDIVDHCLSMHGGLTKRQNAEYAIEDRRGACEGELIRLLNQCFPESIGPSPLEESRAAEERSRKRRRSPTVQFRAPQSPREPRPPDAKRLLGWCHVFRLERRAGVLRATRCQVPGCGLPVPPPHKGFNPWDHLPKHTKRPTDECDLCGFRARGSIENHFRRAHPAEAKIQSHDIRSYIEDELVAALFACYPGIGDAAPFYKATLPGELLPVKWLRFLDRIKEDCPSPLSCAFPGCASPSMGSGAYPLVLEAHILGHQSTAAFSCLACRFEGASMVEHALAAHTRKGSATAYNYEDHRLPIEAELLRLGLQCFPGAYDLDSTGLPDIHEKAVEPADSSQAAKKSGGGAANFAAKDDDTKPKEFLYLVRCAEHFARSLIPGLSCGVCGTAFKSTSQFELHTANHIRPCIYECSECGLKLRYKRLDHLAAEHPAQPAAAFRDRRLEFEAQLIEALHRVLPFLHTLAFWFPEAEKLHVAEAISALAKSGATRVTCKKDGCDYSLQAYEIEGKRRLSEIRLHSHLLSHFEVPVFGCHMCRFRGQEIRAHLEEHHAKAKGRCYDDWRPDHDAELEDLVEIFVTEE